MLTSTEINEIAKALSKLQGSMRPAVKDSNNPFFKSKYTSIAGIWDTIREFLDALGLSVLQDAKSSENGISVVTRICHSSGQWVECGPLEIPAVKKDPQGFGSAVSYARRYALASALGIVSDDDDGERAMQSFRAPQVTKITQDQADVLNILLKYNPEVKKKVDNFMKSQNAKSFTDLPAENYDKIRKSINKHIEEAILKEEEMTDGED